MGLAEQRPGFAIGPIVIALVMSLAVGASATALWYFLDEAASARIAERAESESYATRSNLARSLQVQMQGLREVASFWDSYASMPPDLWDRDARTELSRFQGVAVILWTSQNGSVRYVITPDDFALDRRPDDEQWESYRPILQGIIGSERTPAIIGPTASDAGWTYRVRYPGRDASSGGMLIAQFKVDELLNTLLIDRSPGYAIEVYWGDHRIFSRGEPAADMPEEWTREGWIELPTGPMWRVVHAPTAELLENLSEPSIPGVLIAGWLIAILVAVLVLQNSNVRRRAEEAESARRRVVELNQDLERQVEARTRELATRTSDLETISESVSHDLRNPLNNIGLNAALLRQEFGDDADTIEVVDGIERGIERMVRILDRLDGFSRVTFTPFQPQQIDMNALVDEICEELGPAESGRTISFERDELPVCEADPRMMRTLLLNLLSNSCKYTRSKTDARIEVRASTDNGHVTYSVRDNGIGFAEGSGDEMFKPFTRFGNGAGAEGRGVGLAIAARIVHRHGGQIWAEAKPDQGAEFFFQLDKTAN